MRAGAPCTGSGACRAGGQHASLVGAEGSLPPSQSQTLRQCGGAALCCRQLVSGHGRGAGALHPAAAAALSRLPRAWGAARGGGGGGNAGESSLQNPPRLPNLGTLPLYHHPARGLGAEMPLMKVLVQIDSTELVCLMWGGGMVAGRRGERRAPSQPPLKHAGLGIWSELALLAGPLFPSAHTCAFCLSAVFPPPLSPLAAIGRIRKQRPQTGTYRCPHRPVAQER